MTFDVGDVVIVCSVPNKYSALEGVLQNRHGTIADIYLGPDREYPYAVAFNEIKNEKSSEGWFWLNETNLNTPKTKNTKHKKENDTMNKFLNDRNYKFATVVSFDKAARCAVCAYQGELKENDVVVCDFGYSNGQLSARKVTGVDVPVEIINNIDGEILGVTDCSAYYERKVKAEKRAELKRKMTEQAKKYQEEAFWANLAELDPTMKKLYNEFKELG